MNLPTIGPDAIGPHPFRKLENPNKTFNVNARARTLKLRARAGAHKNDLPEGVWSNGPLDHTPSRASG